MRELDDGADQCDRVRLTANGVHCDWLCNCYSFHDCCGEVWY